MRRALLLEDDEVLGEAMRGALEDAGYAAVLCTQLDDARAAIKDERPVVAVVDLSLPGEFGADLLEELAADDNAPPAVVCSAFSLAELIAARYHVPCVRKPFELDELLAAVDHAVADDTRPRKVA